MRTQIVLSVSALGAAAVTGNAGTGGGERVQQI